MKLVPSSAGIFALPFFSSMPSIFIYIGSLYFIECYWVVYKLQVYESEIKMKIN